MTEIKIIHEAINNFNVITGKTPVKISLGRIQREAFDQLYPRYICKEVGERILTFLGIQIIYTDSDYEIKIE